MGPAVLPTLSSPEVSTIKGLLGRGAGSDRPQRQQKPNSERGGSAFWGTDLDAFPIPGLKLSYC